MRDYMLKLIRPRLSTHYNHNDVYLPPRPSFKLQHFQNKILLTTDNFPKHTAASDL